ncbi:hypothetical protein M0804_013388 [Polistes exclamans]|nr:hypothetical protein M0804_013388 [Polistes exclamans]
MSSEDLLPEDNQNADYQEQALRMMNPYKQHKLNLFYTWLNEFEYVADIIGVPDDKMVDLFTRMMQHDVRKNEPGINYCKLSYDKILTHYIKLLTPIPEIQIHRKRFMCRDQYEKEPLLNYADNLYKIFTKCNFKYCVENKLYERFIHGIRNNNARTYLKKMFSTFDEIRENLNKLPKDNEEEEKDQIFIAWLNKFEYVAENIGVPDQKMVELFNNMRKRFLCRNQYEQETIENYAKCLRKIINKCCYKTDLEERLCEQFINGIHDDEIRTHLKNHTDLSFDEMTTKAIEFDKNNLITNYVNSALLMTHPYNPKKKIKFYAWLNKFEYVADIVKVPDSKMLQFFNHMVVNNVHTEIRINNTDVNLSKLSYDDATKLYYRYLSTSKETDLYKQRFKCRYQFENETIENYADSLCKIYNNSSYKNSKEDKLLEQFINGIREDKIRTKLKEFDVFSFDETVIVASHLSKLNEITNHMNKGISMIHIFSLKNEDKFYEWLNKFEYVADVIEVPHHEMIKFFNEMVDNDVHSAVKKFFSSVEFSELSYDKIINHYLCYFVSSNETDSQRKRFLCRNQYEQETIENYAKCLRKIINKCCYKTDLEERLCEQFINGIHDDEIRTHLKNHTDLSFDEMTTKAIEFDKNNLITNYVNSALLMAHPYNPKNKIKFYAWLNKFEYVADIVKVPDNKMLQLFNHMVVNKVHTEIRINNTDVNLSKLSYDDATKLYYRYLSTSKETDLYKQRFKCRYQFENETIENYADSLRKIYHKSSYKNSKEDKLLEQFINGIREDRIRTKLKEFDVFSFDETVIVASHLSKLNEITNHMNKGISMIHIFSLKNEDKFYEWLNKFEYVADVIEVPHHEMIKFFNEMVDNDVHSAVKKFFSSVEFSELSYDKIINYYLRYFSFPKKTDLHRNRFHCRNQYEGETIQNYADSLQKIYNKCYYKQRREKKLCEYFIKGIRDDDLKCILSKIPCTSFNATVAKAIGFTNVIQINDFITPALSMIQSYNPEKDGLFYEWLNKFEYVADTIGVPDNLMVEFFNGMVDDDVHESVMETNQSVNFSELSYDEIINHYLRYFSSSDDIDLHRKRFLCRNQYEQESIENYADCLRKIYYKCSDINRLEEELCIQFLNGIRDDKIKAYFKEFPRLSFDHMIVMIIAFQKEITFSRYYK